MTKFENAKKNFCAVAEKVTSSKAYKAVEKGAVTAGAAITTLGFMGMSAFAEGADLTTFAISNLKADDIISTAQPFITAGIPILCIVGGLKLGIRFLRGSMH